MISQIPSGGGSPRNLLVSVRTDKEAYVVGQPVVITVLVSNTGNETVDLYSGSLCGASFYVEDSFGVALYDWHRHFGCLDEARLTLSPGQTVEYPRFEWDQVNDEGSQVPTPGTFTVKGSFHWIASHSDPVQFQVQGARISVSGFSTSMQILLTPFAVSAVLGILFLAYSSWPKRKARQPSPTTSEGQPPKGQRGPRR